MKIFLKFSILATAFIAHTAFSWDDDRTVEYFYGNCTKGNSGKQRTKCVGYPLGCLVNKTCLFVGSVTGNSTDLTAKILEKCGNTLQSLQDPDNWTIQGLEGFGIATLDKSMTKFECRKPEIEDYKFFFLFNDTSICNDTDVTSTSYSITELNKNKEEWLTLCKNHKERIIPPSPNANYKFNLRYFLQHFMSAWSNTKYFQPPFEFADTYNYNVADNNMFYYGGH